MSTVESCMVNRIRMSNLNVLWVGIYTTVTFCKLIQFKIISNTIILLLDVTDYILDYTAVAWPQQENILLMYDGHCRCPRLINKSITSLMSLNLYYICLFNTSES